MKKSAYKIQGYMPEVNKHLSVHSLPDKYNIFSDEYQNGVGFHAHIRINEEKKIGRICMLYRTLPKTTATEAELRDHNWLPIPWIYWNTLKRVPFGYKYDPEDPVYKEYPELDPEASVVPVPEELVGLEIAKRLTKTYSYRSVAEWLTAKTGRKIDGPGLKDRISLDHQREDRARFFRQIAARLAKAIAQAEAIEKTTAGAGRKLNYDIFGEALYTRGRPRKEVELEEGFVKSMGPKKGR